MPGAGKGPNLGIDSPAQNVKGNGGSAHNSQSTVKYGEAAWKLLFNNFKIFSCYKKVTFLEPYQQL